MADDDEFAGLPEEEESLKDSDWAGATQAYSEGGNSVSKGSYRTLQGFSTGAYGKMYDGCP